ncbi:protein UNUSUAL FLORAL ORGANS [Impatiens glandulifera]|uniref:protein UNUSUAL FLORAL ORGANS n=1 Tax=Impatiens glandulifera TaxID=253017 RepID=UPI001FB062F3|nr:protein UNUSUAL FLORAL ORGANS [Impatiens glandulifera]
MDHDFNTSSLNIPPISYPNFVTSPITSPWMDARIWSRIPPRLLDRILTFLPPTAFFRARSVCKRFYALLFSPPFLDLYLQIPHQLHTWFIFFMQNVHITNMATNNTTHKPTFEAYLLNPNEASWHRVHFPLIPPGYSPSASSGGLICWVSNEPGSKSLLLSNPIIGSISPLPPTLAPRLFPSVGLAVTNSSVDVTVAGDDMVSPYAVKNLSSESFHLDNGGFYSVWGTTCCLPRLCSLESGQMVHARGKFYCMNYSPFSVLEYDVAANNWSKIQAPMRRFLRSPTLTESRGRLLLVAAVEKSKLNVPKSLRLWALQECGGAWAEVERMPHQLYLQFEEVEGCRGFTCIGHGDFVFIMIKQQENRSSSHGHGNINDNKLGLLFDFYRKNWTWIGPCPYIINDDGGDRQELVGFAYEPRLATPTSGLVDHLAAQLSSV